MRVKIHTPECHLSLALPTRVIFSSLTATLVCRGINHTKIMHKSGRRPTAPSEAEKANSVSGEIEAAVSEAEAAVEELRRAEEELKALEAEAAREEEDGFPEEPEDDPGGDPQEHRLTAAQMRELFKALRECRKTYPGLVLVDVQSAAGEIVQITL